MTLWMSSYQRLKMIVVTVILVSSIEKSSNFRWVEETEKRCCVSLAYHPCWSFIVSVLWWYRCFFCRGHISKEEGCYALQYLWVCYWIYHNIFSRLEMFTNFMEFGRVRKIVFREWNLMITCARTSLVSMYVFVKLTIYSWIRFCSDLVILQKFLASKNMWYIYGIVRRDTHWLYSMSCFAANPQTRFLCTALTTEAYCCMCTIRNIAKSNATYLISDSTADSGVCDWCCDWTLCHPLPRWQARLVCPRWSTLIKASVHTMYWL